MPDPTVGSRAEVEIALRDSLSPGLRAMARDIRALNRSIKAMADEGDAGMTKMGKSTAGMSTVTKQAVRDLTIMGNFMTGFTKGLVGSLGTAAAIEGVTRAIHNLAESRVQLSAFSRDTRFAAVDIHGMRRALANLGIDAKQSDTYIGGLSTKLQELSALKQGSTLFQDLAKMGPRGVELGNRLMGAAGDHKKMLTDIVEVYRTQGADVQFMMSQVLGVPKSVLDQMLNYKAVHSGVLQANEEDMRRYLTKLNELKETGSTIWSRYASHVVGKVNEMMNVVPDVPTDPISDWLIKDFDKFLAKARATKEELQAIVTAIQNFNEATKPGNARKAIEDRFAPFGLGNNLKNRLDQSFGDLEKENNRLLADIRDTLQRMEGTKTVGGTSGGAGSQTGYGVGAQREGGPLKAPVGGFRPDRADKAAGRYTGEETYSTTPGVIDRSRFAKELEANPALREKIMGIAAGENKDPRANLAVIESLMNRAAMRGTTLEQEARLHRQSGRDEGGYYAGYDPGSLSRPKIRAMIEENMRKALAGSNISNYATDNASQGLAAKHKATGAFRPQFEAGGETFFSPGWQRAGRGRTREAYEAWRKRLDEAAQQQTTARENIDRQNRKPSVFELGTAAVKVDFGNVPPGVKTQAQGDGVFKDLKITRESQSPKAGNSAADFSDRWYFQ